MPGLDDRRRDEHVGVAGEERVHALLELALSAIWPCATRKRRPGQSCRELLRRLVDRLDAVVEVERLPAARVLALERQS